MTDSSLVIENLHVSVSGKEILKGVNMEICPGEVHVVMGPNGSGKSTLSYALMGHPEYKVTDGQVTLDGQDLLPLPSWQRAQSGLFLCLQHPIEVPGVTLESVLTEAARAAGKETDTIKKQMIEEAESIGFEEKFLERPLNVDLSGGEKKRNETLQLGVLGARYAVLDEIDSGLDVDALAAVSQRIQGFTQEQNLGVLAITHFSRLLEVLEPDQIHILNDGSIQMTGGPELVDRLEEEGYQGLLDN
ncbi:MAG: Vegetative protein 296 [Acidimicrobiales bacterium AG-410-I20]|nr:MAG: Vegetative protein 296 [Acidimicrobiales bacterium AG-410-I20]